MGSASSSIVKSAIHAATSAPVSGIAVGGDLLVSIISLTETVAQKRSSARYLAKRCEGLCISLGQYEKIPLSKRTVQYRDQVFKCLNQVKDMLTKWADKSWMYMLIHQGEFEGDLDRCDKGISDCLLVFNTATHMEALGHQQEGERRRILEEVLATDRKTDLAQFASPDFVRQVTENKLTENDQKTVSIMMQKSLTTVSQQTRKGMSENLYHLLQSSGLVPRELQLNSGEVEWTQEGSNVGNVDMYKGRYLQSEDVRIKVIRSVNMKDEKAVRRVRREVEVWAKLYQMDKGKHIIPFYGFYSPDGLRLALVSPWMNNGDALAYVKRQDTDVDYRKLMPGIAEGIKVLHSMSIVHGNLRGVNVLIGEEGQPLITDFALAKLEGNMITETASQSDSARWCAPELFEAQAAVSANGDIYALGMTILELFTHEMPYSDIRKNIQVVFKKAQGELPHRPQDERVVRRGLDDRMWELLCQCWAKKPNDRPTIEQLSVRLSSLVSPGSENT